jgi:type IV pilus assembly protein PilM
MFAGKRVLALDIGASKLVLAEFSVARSEGPQLLNYDLAPLDVEPEAQAGYVDAVSAAIREMMRRSGLRPAPLLMTVSGQAVFPRFVKLPPVSRDKIAHIVRYEAEQNVPFPIEEVVWDYTLIGAEEGDLNVMLVAAKIESVRLLTSCVAAAGMEPEIVDAAPMALCNAVRYNYPDIAGCTMVLDIGARASNLIFVEGNRIFSRSIPVAGNAITTDIAKEFEVPEEEAEALKREHAFVAFGGVYGGPDSEVADRVSKIVRNVITRLHAEVNRSINFYRSQQGGSAPTFALLTGGSSVIPHTDTFFREKLNIEVEYFNPFLGIAVDEKVDAERISRDVSLLGAVAGLSLRRALSCPVEINLLPPELVAKKVFRKRQPYFGLAAAGVVLIMLCWWVYFHQMRGVLNAQSAKVKDRISSLADIVKRMEDVSARKGADRERADQVLRLASQRTRWLDMLDSIHANMLEGMWLTAVRPVLGDDGAVTHVEISGKGFVDKLVNKPGLSAIEDFRDRLRKSPYFTEGTEIRKEPPVGSEAFAREFVIWAAVKDPMRLR